MGGGELMRQLTRIYVGANDEILTVETTDGDSMTDPVSIIDSGGNELVLDIWLVELDGHADGRFTRARDILNDMEKPPGRNTAPGFKASAERPLQARGPVTKL